MKNVLVRPTFVGLSRVTFRTVLGLAAICSLPSVAGRFALAQTVPSSKCLSLRTYCPEKQAWVTSSCDDTNPCGLPSDRKSAGSDSDASRIEVENRDAADAVAERQRQAEAARIEREGVAEEKRKRDADFIRNRDAAAKTLKGGISTWASPNGSGLKGSGMADTGLKEPRRTDRVNGDAQGLRLTGGETEGTNYLYALQAGTLTPMAYGGHPIDAPGSPPVGMHGLVGGTTWTFGFRWPHVKCEKQCQDNMKRNLDGQLALFCSSQSDPKKCLATGLPFTSEMYDFVVSMGSSHVAIEDLATRVLFDGTTFGEFSRQHREIFASLKGRQFDTLDCHSNGAMLCLAALRSGETTAKEVRLFAPQMNPEAAKRWQEYAANTRTTIKIYLNYGDPVTAISWKQPAPQTAAGKAVTAAWLSNPVTGPATLADALFYSYFDSKTGVMDATLKHYGFDVMRSKCNDSPSLDCHSMKLYEKQLHEKNGEPRAK